MYICVVCVCVRARILTVCSSLLMINSILDLCMPTYVLLVCVSLRNCVGVCVRVFVCVY